MERSYGSFTRSFTLPNVGRPASKIKAEYKDGVLQLTLPKREEAKPQADHHQRGQSRRSVRTPGRPASARAPAAERGAGRGDPPRRRRPPGGAPPQEDARNMPET